MKANVYKITLMVIDFEEMGEEQVIALMEQSRHLSPSVRDCAEISVEWDDSHPLNQAGWEAAFDASFDKGDAP